MGVRAEFLVRHERTDITYAMRRLHLVLRPASKVFDRSIFFLPWRVVEKRSTASPARARARLPDGMQQTVMNSSFTLKMPHYCTL